MNRRGFLASTIGLVAGLRYGRLPTPSPQVVPFILKDVRVELLTASGGLCAPLTPVYKLPCAIDNVHPIRDAIPSFSAQRS
jgi:hypothetical protein